MTNRKPSVDRDLIPDIIESVNSQHGSSLMLLEGTGGRWPKDRVIRTGSLNLDMALGIGGWPRGRVVEVFGNESCGKTTMALHAVREAQAQGLLVAYLDGENALDPTYARKLGVDLESLLISQTNGLEQVIDIMITLLRGGQVGMIVVDSIPSLVPMSVMEASAENEPSMALAARIWSRNLPKVAKAAAESNCLVMNINQTRTGGFGSFTGPTEDTPGGKALKFFYSCRLKMWRRTPNKKEDGLAYQECNLDVIKNKVGPPFRKGQFNIVPGEPIDWVEDVLMQGIAEGYVRADTKIDGGEVVKKKSWNCVYLNEEMQAAAVEDDPDLDLDTLPRDEEGDPYLQAYYLSKFIELMRKYPSVIEILEERILDSLNVGATVSTSDLDDDSIVGPVNISADDDVSTEDVEDND